ncbi:MAG: anthranilate synthase component I family protein [Clostridia bacterium]
MTVAGKVPEASLKPPYAIRHRTFPVDQETPITAFLKLRPYGAHTLLESVEGDEKVARYSFIAVGELARLTDEDGTAVLKGEAGDYASLDPTWLLREGWRQYRARVPEDLTLPYTGGAVGYLAYDWVRTLERLPHRHAKASPGWHFVWPRTILGFDHRRQTLTVVSQVREGREADADTEIARVLAVLREPFAPTTSVIRRTGPLTSNQSLARYRAMVDAARRHIAAGDIFQVVLSQKLSAPVEGDALGLYRRLRRLNPSPYLFYLETAERTLVGSSPELLVRVQGNYVATRPIAGTRPRGASPEEDNDLWSELSSDDKERAEHVMLVDLGRNDLGRVAVPGSVRVTRFMERELYSHVMHMVSDVEARLRSDLDALDALQACFPAGTLSGAPKIRAMELIDELEPEGRGAYGGVVGYLSHDGSLDACITIRTLEVADGVATVQAGGGIVADSEPDREYQESLNKARALIAVLDDEEEWH